MKLSIDKKITQDFPDAKIGWLRARIADGAGAARGRNVRIAEMKKKLEANLNDMGISADTLTLHPDVRRWRETYS